MLLYTIKKCVGPQVFDQTAMNGWCKIYSRMLDEIIPVVVHFELTNKQIAEKIYDKRMSVEAPTTNTALFSKTTQHASGSEESRNPNTVKTV